MLLQLREMVEVPSLFSLCIRSVSAQITNGGCDDVEELFELPSDILDVIIMELPPVALQHLHELSLDRCGRRESTTKSISDGRKRGRHDTFNTAWKKLYKKRWPETIEKMQKNRSMTMQDDVGMPGPVDTCFDWQQLYWEAHLQNLDEAAERALLPASDGHIGGIEMSAQDELRNLMGTILDDYTVFASGSTPEIVAAMVVDNLVHLPAEAIPVFTSVMLITAVGQRRLVEDFLSKPGNIAVVNFLRERFYIQNHLNYSALNMAGHCIMAAAGATAVPMITAFRAKLGANSIWECNLARTSLSDSQKRIFGEKVARHSQDSARLAGRRIITALTRRLEHATLTATEGIFPRAHKERGQGSRMR